VQRDRDRLLRAFYLALAAGGFQFAMLEFMHYSLDRLFLRWTLMRCHSSSPEPLNDTAPGKTSGAVTVPDVIDPDLVP